MRRVPMLVREGRNYRAADGLDRLAVSRLFMSDMSENGRSGRCGTCFA